MRPQRKLENIRKLLDSCENVQDVREEILHELTLLENEIRQDEGPAPFIANRASEITDARLLQCIVDGVPDILALQTVDHTIIAYNRAGYEALNLPPERVNGRKCYELIGHSKPCEPCATTLAIKSGKTETYQKFIPETNSWVQVHAIPVRNIDGNIEFFVEQIRDITSEMRSEQQLQQALESAQTANQAKSEFLANTSHELRTPLHGLLGAADLLAQDKLTPAQAELISTVTQCGSVLLKLVNDILDTASIENGTLAFHYEPFPLQDLANKLRAQFYVQLKARNLTLHIEGTESLPTRAVGDPLRIQQLLGNLVSNAIKFSPEGDSIGIEITTTALGPGRARCSFAVTDNGPGVAPEKAAKIFEPFVQGDPSSSREYQGSGLGLAIASALAERMGGSLTLRSSPGNGAQFTYTQVFDVSTPEDTLTCAGPTTEANVCSLRVLLAEDNHVNQRLAMRILEGGGHHVTLAQNGEEAVKLHEQEQFDIILMDIQMPRMSGEEAVRLIRKKDSQTPIIALTAHSMVGDADRYLLQGMDSYLSKPFDRASLLSKLAEFREVLEAR